MKVSIVFPCYNESASIKELVKRCALLAEQEKDLEFIFVDNGSTDESGSIFESVLPEDPRFVLVSVNTNRGYGHGIVKGLEVSRGDIVGWTHADLQSDPKDLIEAIALFEDKGCDLFVKGFRYGRPFLDQVFTVGMSVFESILFRRLLLDINAQPTLFPREMFRQWESPPEDFSLDLYALIFAKKSGARVRRFPVRFGSRRGGVSSWNVGWRSRLRFILRTVKYSYRLAREL